VKKKLTLLLFVALFVCGDATAQVPGPSFLNLTPSARSWGMGRAGAAVVDPYISFFNPGGSAIYANGARLTLAGNSQDWLKRFYESSNFSNSVAIIGFPLISRDSSWATLNFAVSYLRMHIEGAGFTDSSNPPVDNRFELRDLIDSYTGALALGRGLSIGVGGSIKSYSEWQYIGGFGGATAISGVARDIGVFLRVPVIAARSEYPLARMRYDFEGFQPELWVIASYGWANFGNKGKAPWDYFYRPLPRVNRFGRTVIAGLTYHDAQCVQVLLTRDDEIKKTGGGESRREGWEVSVLGIVQFRQGSYPTGGSDPDTETSGESYRLSGLWQWLDIIAGRKDKSIVPTAIRGLDVVFQRARIKESSNSFLGGTDLWEFAATVDFASVLGK